MLIMPTKLSGGDSQDRQEKLSTTDDRKMKGAEDKFSALSYVLLCRHQCHHNIRTSGSLTELILQAPGTYKEAW
jgi:hypothetical protein